MADDRLHVAFLWHMHQPYYREAGSGACQMPWVRLHATKDYNYMPRLIGEYPQIRANFNLVPSLVKQVLLYNEGRQDQSLIWSRKPASELSRSERVLLLRHFFLANAETMIRPYSAYADLLSRRGNSLKDEDLESRLVLFTDQDFLDLQTWYNLVWIDPLERQTHPELIRLLNKGRGFSEEEKHWVLDLHLEMMKRTLPLYRGLQDRGQIEISTSPYYHPILPLLCDTEIARESMREIQLPERFAHPEDARVQIERAVHFHEQCFGERPRGMWPSEGSVSPQAVALIAQAGIGWIATDEAILDLSLGADWHTTYAGRRFKPDVLYQPFWWQGSGGERLQIVFRDHELSDRIGFVYSGWDAKSAADDLIARLRAIRQEAAGSKRPPLVSIVLDGENAWEYYPGNGEAFLRHLYEGLSAAQDIQTVRLGDYLREHPADQTLPRLFAGSWINHNFKIWIGHPEDHASWNALSRAREELSRWTQEHAARPDDQRLQNAWEAVYIAEGSDWNWWYGDDHSSSLDMEFDALYRQQLLDVYRQIDRPAPDDLQVPLRRGQPRPGTLQMPTGFISPNLDGFVGDYYEWLNAGRVREAVAGSAMHQVDTAIAALYFGFDLDRLYLRLDFKPRWWEDPEREDHELIIRILQPVPRLVRLRSWLAQPVLELYRLDDQDRWVLVKDGGLQGACGRILEIAMPFVNLGAKAGDELSFWVFVRQREQERERYPRSGPVAIQVPAASFADAMWEA